MSHDDDIAWVDDDVPLYTLTAGRTRPDHTDLDMETLVMATPHLDGTALEPEHRRILALCPTWRAVAEISAGLGVPLMVVRIQLSDLIGRHAITVSAPRHDTAEGPHTRTTLLRVLNGLRAM